MDAKRTHSHNLYTAVFEIPIVKVLTLAHFLAKYKPYKTIKFTFHAIKGYNVYVGGHIGIQLIFLYHFNLHKSQHC